MEISSLLYRHQTVIMNYILTRDESYDKELRLLSDELIEEIKLKLSEFGDRMSGDEREQLYHKVYSNFYSYLQNVDISISLCDDGQTETAYYYAENIMNPLIGKVNESLDALDKLSVTEMNSAAESADKRINSSNVSLSVFIVCIAVSAVITLIYCVKMTAGLEKYKDSLEKEVEEKKIELKRHSEKMMSIQNSTIIGMANLIESRDGDTGEHVKRTSAYVDMLARAAKNQGVYSDILTESYIELLDKAAPLHDIGKISVPDSILQKPGKLTSEEFEIIKGHAAEGGRIIREVMGNIEEQEYVDIAATVASCHHEKWDGGGYPKGLKEYEIPLAARIMALADVFDALVSKRCYKRPMTLEEAFTIIKESEGTHFDPVLAEIFIGLRPQIESYLNNGRIYNNADNS